MHREFRDSREGFSAAEYEAYNSMVDAELEEACDHWDSIEEEFIDDYDGDYYSYDDDYVDDFDPNEFF